MTRVRRKGVSPRVGTKMPQGAKPKQASSAPLSGRYSRKEGTARQQAAAATAAASRAAAAEASRARKKGSSPPRCN
jgi:hypothetical protein